MGSLRCSDHSVYLTEMKDAGSQKIDGAYGIMRLSGKQSSEV